MDELFQSLEYAGSAREARLAVQKFFPQAVINNDHSDVILITTVDHIISIERVLPSIINRCTTSPSHATSSYRCIAYRIQE